MNFHVLINSNVFLQDIYKNGELPVKDFGSEGKLEFPSNTQDKVTLDLTFISKNHKMLISIDFSPPKSYFFPIFLAVEAERLESAPPDFNVSSELSH